MPRGETPQPDPFRPDTESQGSTPGVHNNQEGKQITTGSHGESFVSNEALTADQQVAIDKQGTIHSG